MLLKQQNWVHTLQGQIEVFPVDCGDHFTTYIKALSCPS